MSDVFTMTGVTVRFGGVLAVDDLGFTLPPGEFLGVIGPNGAGKTTMLNCISGVQRPASGEIRLGADTLVGRRPHAVAGLGVARTFQAVEHYKELTVTEYVVLGRVRRLSPSVLRRAVCWPPSLRAERAQWQVARDLAQRHGLGEVLDTPLGELPYGYQKLADIIRAMAMEPRLLLLDEPASGSSADERRALHHAIGDLRRSSCSVVLVDHDVDFVSTLCDRLLAMATGRVICEGTPAEVLADRRVIEHYLGAEVTT